MFWGYTICIRSYHAVLNVVFNKENLHVTQIWKVQNNRKHDFNFPHITGSNINFITDFELELHAKMVKTMDECKTTEMTVSVYLLVVT